MELERLLKALADRTRLRLLNLMREREVCVCYLVEVLKSPQPKISRHLAYLRSAGVVALSGRATGCTTASYSRRTLLPLACSARYSRVLRKIRKCNAT